MIRALEVARVTGRPLSHWQEQFETPAPRSQFPVAVLRLERSWLHQRINLRVESMLERGLKEEVVQLLARYGQLGRTAAQAVGYKEILDHLQARTSMEETTELIKAHTRQFARRQEIWFRGLSELQGVTLTPVSSMLETMDCIANIFCGSTGTADSAAWTGNSDVR
jgi:tRNA dimethylallyltransferase